MNDIDKVTNLMTPFIKEQSNLIQDLVSIHEQKDKYNFTVEVVKCDVPNRNNRIYPKAVVERMIGQLTDGTIGMLGNSTDSLIHFSQASHMISNLRILLTPKGESLYADIAMLDTPCGKIAKSLIDDGVKIAFRTSGVGDCKATGCNEWIIQESYKLITINLLDEASAA